MPGIESGRDDDGRARDRPRARDIAEQDQSIQYRPDKKGVIEWRQYRSHSVFVSENDAGVGDAAKHTHGQHQGPSLGGGW